MKEIVILSGKGGTGKTVISSSFACLAEDKVIADLDVDAADLHLLLKPRVQEEGDFVGRSKAYILEERCDGCGICEEVCRFGAISRGRVDELSCEGCGLCARLCPRDAILMRERVAGRWFISQTHYGPLVHASLGVGEENSGKLVALVKEKAREVAEREGCGLIISDGPPGTGCPVISSLSGASLALIVSEPTMSGWHDLERVLGVARHFGVHTLVCINKFDLNEEQTRLMEERLGRMGVEVISKIPFDPGVPESVSMGIPPVERGGEAAREMERLWERVRERITGR